MLDTTTLVAAPSHNEPLSRVSSTRPPLSDHRRSPVMTGRLRTACAHWSSPAGEKLTLPVKYDSRAIRVGGSAHAIPAPNVTASASASPITNDGKFLKILRVVMNPRFASRITPCADRRCCFVVSYNALFAFDGL